MLTAGIDAGTQSVKVVVYDDEKRMIVASSSSPLPLIEEDGGVREQEAFWWVKAIKECFSSLSDDIRKGISVISVSGQQHGFVPVDKDGNVLYRVKLWCDTSTALECSEIEEALGGRANCVDKLGNPVLPGYTASKIRWLWKNHRELYDRMETFMLPHDYINFYLSGIVVMERGDASGTALMDTEKGEWSIEAAEATAPGLSARLPRIVPKPGIIGTIRKETAADLGLSESVAIASGGGDNMMSAIGTGAVDDGIITMSLGTSGTLFSTSHHPFKDRKVRLASFCSSTGYWLPLLCTMNCTVASETMRKLFDQDVKSFDKAAEDAGIGAGGVMMLPFFNGERVPDYPHGEGVLIGLRQSNTTAANIARATLEGVTYEFLLGLEAFRENGIEPQSLTLTGGGAKSRVWRQLVADMTGCPVRVPEIGEAAAFGAALHGLWCLSGGSIEEIAKEHIRYNESASCSPDKASTDKYKEEYGRWLRYVETLSPIFR